MTRFQPQWLQAGSYAASVDRRLISALWPSPASNGGAVTPTGTGMGVQAAPGQVAVPAGNGTGSVLCSWDAPEILTLDPAPPSGVNRTDVIVCQVESADVGSVGNDEFHIAVIKGAEGAGVPVVPANAVALAQVAVIGGSASVVAGNITDRRPLGLALPPASAQALPIHARVFRAAALNLTNASGVMPYDTADTSSGNINTPGVISGLNTVNARFIIPVAGRYLFTANLNMSGSVAMTMYTQMRKNGVIIASIGAPWIINQAQWGQGPGGSIPVVCQAGDWLDVQNQTNSATAQAIQGGAAQTWMAMSYLGPNP